VPHPAKAFRSARKALHALYAELPEIDCKGLCQASCGRIDECVAPIETEAMISHMATMGVTEPPLVDPQSKACPLLTLNGRCSIHEARPMICRLWGVVQDELMICPWGCKPRKYLSNEETRALYRKLQRISQRYEEETNEHEQMG
jgi:Fe-S-cluster containining protein